MVWADIVMDGRTELPFFKTGSVTAQSNRDEVLEPYVCLLRGAVGPDFITMDYNAPCHRAVLIDDFLETEDIQRKFGYANSPDLNPIEDEVLQCEKKEVIAGARTGLYGGCIKTSQPSSQRFRRVTTEMCGLALS
ncbi:transposable element Tcb2 transposase [Trichonephila clavipes]|nr:transposable element Tcb2 transposase [Trichonephila clavipes]